jgi:hypothetical protein
MAHATSPTSFKRAAPSTQTQAGRDLEGVWTQETQGGSEPPSAVLGRRLLKPSAQQLSSATPSFQNLPAHRSQAGRGAARAEAACCALTRSAGAHMLKRRTHATPHTCYTEGNSTDATQSSQHTSYTQACVTHSTHPTPRANAAHKEAACKG